MTGQGLNGAHAGLDWRKATSNHFGKPELSPRPLWLVKKQESAGQVLLAASKLLLPGLSPPQSGLVGSLSEK